MRASIIGYTFENEMSQRVDISSHDRWVLFGVILSVEYGMRISERLRSLRKVVGERVNPTR